MTIKITKPSATKSNKHIANHLQVNCLNLFLFVLTFTSFSQIIYSKDCSQLIQYKFNPIIESLEVKNQERFLFQFISKNSVPYKYFFKESKAEFNSNQINKQEKPEKHCKESCEKTIFILIIKVLIIFLVILTLIYFINSKKNKRENRIQKDIINTSYRIGLSSTIEDNISLEDLIIKAKKTDPLFSSYFEKKFPVFYTRLNEQLIDVTVNDLKFCLFLKLKLSSKEIADNMHVSLKAIYNRNNRFRKRIKIKEGEDLYTWAENFDK